MKRIVLIWGIALMTFMASGIDVKVNLFTGHKVTRVELGHVSGKYLLFSADQEIATLSHGESIVLQVVDSMIHVFEGGVVKATARDVYFAGIGMENTFSCKVNGFSSRSYEGNLKMNWTMNGMTMINLVDLEKYVGGVIQSEAGGSTNHLEYFKVQALVSRTYALRLIIMNDDNFCLADDVTNQVYKGKLVNPVISEAVSLTAGEVILYGDTQLINAVFHSNSGGLTLPSEMVWASPLPYLKPVLDTFSVGQPNFSWSKSMPAIEWLNYLDKSFGYPVHNDSMRLLALTFSPDQRSGLFVNDIPLTKIRNDLKLKSTWFQITQEHDQVVFTGRGYGHGVGLSQEGAIRMAEMGYTAGNIIRYYYTGVDIKNLSEVPLLASAR